ncbi:MAG: magnesium transporter [Acidimicrobiia bacterium]
MPLIGRLRALLGSDAAGARQSLVALCLNSSTSLVAGAFLGAITGTLEEFPGLLVLVPAAIGLRGNIFGAFGNRMSTSIHAGTFRLSARRETILGQNVLASMILTLAASLLLAVTAKGVAVGLGVPGSVALLDLVVISVVAGLLGSAVVLACTLALTAGAVRYDWDLDNVSAPMVSVLGDVLTLPAVFGATYLVGVDVVSPVLGLVLVAGSASVLVVGWRAKLPILRGIVRESMPVLVLAGCVSLFAGIALEKSFDAFGAYPALLVLVPAHLSSGGALGGILAGRLATKMLLGTCEAATTPDREARRDIGLLFLVALPVYLFNALGAQLVADLSGAASPGWALMVAASLIAGLGGMVLVVAVGYYSTVAAIRVGLDPDNYGIPVVSSSVDFVGAVTLVITIAALGIA